MSDNYSARPYQLELFDKALDHNSIICLGTGTGKTFIAAMLIRYLAHGIRGEFQQKNGKRTFFLVNTVNLAIQQCNYLKEHTDLKVKYYIGSLNVDLWDKEKWGDELMENEVFVMTAQIMSDMLAHGFIKLCDINLIIFDECHSARGNHPFRIIMKHFSDYPKDDHPRILGLSACLLNGKSKKHQLMNEIRDLELTLHACVETSLDLISTSGANYHVTPDEYLERIPTIADDNVTLINNFLVKSHKSIEVLPETVVINDVDIEIEGRPKRLAEAHIRDCFAALSTLGILGLAFILKKLETEIQDLSIFGSNIEMRNTGEVLRQIFHECFLRCKDILSADDSGYMNCVSPKVQKLIKLLSKTKELFECENPTVIIFVERRITAVGLSCVLNNFINSVPSLQNFKCCHITGHGPGTDIKAAQQSAKKQEEILQLFRENKINLLVATNVIEEGIDIPKCNLVVRFDSPSDYRSYIQSKGRARADPSAYIIFCESDMFENLCRDISSYKETEKTILNICSSREIPSINESELALNDDLIKPYKPFPDSPTQINVHNAISLINRYCGKLPSDSYSSMVAKCTISTLTSESFRAELQLPMSSPIRTPIFSDVLPSKRLAKASAALNACIELHKLGELNDNLLPITNILPNNVEEVSDVIEKGPTGSKKRRRTYDKLISNEFSSGLPIANVECNVYKIITTLRKDLSEVFDHKRLFATMCHNTTRKFCLLTRNSFQRIPSFPIYTRRGEDYIRIEFDKKVVLSHDEVNTIFAFHEYLFDRVLRTKTTTLSFDAHNSSNQVIVGILDSDDDGNFLDFEEMNSVLTKSRVPYIKPHPFKFNPDDYKDTVVSPNYRNQENNPRLYVAVIRNDLNPMSSFPKSIYETYYDYYKQKYGVEITNLKQPLLEVDYVNTRLNMLTPRYFNKKCGTTTITEDGKLKVGRKFDPDSRQLFVPELSIIWPLTSSLWKKAANLPSILHRLDSLLLAEDFRKDVARNTGFGCIDLPKPYPFPDLDFNWELYSSKDSGNNEVALQRQNTKHFVDVYKTYGPSPCDFLQCLTLANASDGFNLERFETIGDSFLKCSVSIYLFCNHDRFDEGKLTRARSDVVSNRNLYKQGVKKNIPQRLHSSLFDPFNNWLPPGFYFNCEQKEKSTDEENESVQTLPESEPKVTPRIEKTPDWNDLQIGVWSNDMLKSTSSNKTTSSTYNPMKTNPAISNQQTLELWAQNNQQTDTVWESSAKKFNGSSISSEVFNISEAMMEDFMAGEAAADFEDESIGDGDHENSSLMSKLPSRYVKEFVGDKSVADCVEAIIGCILTRCGEAAAKKFMTWFNITVEDSSPLKIPKSIPDDIVKSRAVDIDHFTSGFDRFESIISYHFNDIGYLLQAFTHSSFCYNRLTDCYQRLEFLGDAILDYLITRHLFNDEREFSPGSLTDLRSALVNNTLFASLAVRHQFHRFLKHASPLLEKHLTEFVQLQSRVDHLIGFSDDLSTEDESEDVAIPKPLGDVFESVAGAIFLDSGMDIEAVWKTYYPFMKDIIDIYSQNIPISPIRELQELEPEHLTWENFISDGKHCCKLSVSKSCCVLGMGQTYKSAKIMAARKALRKLKNESCLKFS